MNNTHSKLEQGFYENLFQGKTKFGKNCWGTYPSQSMVELLERHSLINGVGRRALDIGCGEGRHIAFLRQCGYEVVGIDFTKYAINKCKEKFAGDTKVSIKNIDLTIPDSLNDLGKFDLVLQWSVLDHIRVRYIKIYLDNVFRVIGDFFIISEFATFLEKFKNKSYKIKNGHYSRCYTIEELLNVFRLLNKIDFIEHTDVMKEYEQDFHTILFQKLN